MPIQAPSFQFDPRKLRERALFDNYGMQHPDDIDPGFTQELQNPINDPGFEREPTNPISDPGFNFDLKGDPMGITRADPNQDPFAANNFSVKPPAGISPSPSYQDMVDQLGSFDTPMQDKYNGLLNARPERERPGIMRSIVAAGMGLGEKDPSNAFKLEEDIMNAPYNRKMADWTSQVEPAYRSAQLENTANANERQMRSSVLTNKTNMDRYADMNDQATRRNDLQQKKQDDAADVAKIRAEAYDFKMRHPDWKFDFSGPQVIAASPDGSQAVKLGPTGHMSDVDKINLNQKNEIERIHARGDEAQQTKSTPSGTPTGGSGNPVVQRNMRFQNVYDTATDEEKSFMIPPATTNGSWQFAKRPTKGILTGSKDYAAKVAAYDALVAKVNGNGAKIGPSQTTPPPAAKTSGLGPSTTPSPAPSPAKEPSYVPRGEYGGKVEGGDNTPWIAKPFIPAAKAIGEHITKGAAGMGESGLPPQQVMTPDGPRTVPPGEVAVADPTGKPMGTIPRSQLADAIKNGWKEIK